MMTDEEMIHCRVPERQLERAIAIMHRLRIPGGCPWDAEQTHESIISNLLEEAYECIDAIRANDRPHMREELGDVLLQVLFHAELATEATQDAFDINDIACELSDKLVRRHPHVFGTSAVNDTEGVLNQWDAIKRKEQSIEDKPYLKNCGNGLPALLKAAKITKKVAKVGFDWPDHAGVVEKIREETDEVAATLNLPDTDPQVEEELGDLLFCTVNLCRRRGIDPEVALDAANRKFERRFNMLEKDLKAQGLTLQEATTEQMEAAWQRAKQQEKS
jgi:MazG family protein